MPTDSIAANVRIEMVARQLRLAVESVAGRRFTVAKVDGEIPETPGRLSDLLVVSVGGQSTALVGHHLVKPGCSVRRQHDVTFPVRPTTTDDASVAAMAVAPAKTHAAAIPRPPQSPAFIRSSCRPAPLAATVAATPTRLTNTKDRDMARTDSSCASVADGRGGPSFDRQPTMMAPFPARLITRSGPTPESPVSRFHTS